VNWRKVATHEPIIEYSEGERGTYTQGKPAEEIVGTSIMLDCGISFEVVETPEEIDELLREVLLSRIFKKE
jgi:hypothetical protein